MSRLSGWESLLAEARKMQARDSGALYDRLLLLEKVYLGPEYVQAMRDSGVGVTDRLDEAVGEVSFNFTELHLTMRMFPSRDEWVRRGTRELVRAMLSATRRTSAGGVLQAQRFNCKRMWEDEKRRRELLEARLAEMERELKALRNREAGAA